jgi:hypothetical protein
VVCRKAGRTVRKWGCGVVASDLEDTDDDIRSWLAALHSPSGGTKRKAMTGGSKGKTSANRAGADPRASSHSYNSPVSPAMSEVSIMETIIRLEERRFQTQIGALINRSGEHPLEYPGEYESSQFAEQSSHAVSGGHVADDHFRSIDSRGELVLEKGEEKLRGVVSLLTLALFDLLRLVFESIEARCLLPVGKGMRF